MKLDKKQQFFCYLLIACIGISILLISCLANSIRKAIISELYSIEFVVSSKIEFDAVLLYAYDREGLDYNHKILDSSHSRDTLRFLFPNDKRMLTKHRLDFGRNTFPNEIVITKIIYKFKNKVYQIEESNVFSTFFFKSGSVDLDRINNIVLVNEKAATYNPYIIFKPMAQTILDNHHLKLFFLLLPFISLPFAAYFLGIFPVTKIKLEEILLLILIVSIPLKISWTTFSVILLCALGLYRLVKYKNKHNIVWSGFLLVVFLLILIIGRSTSYDKIHIYLGLLLFSFIAMILDWHRESVIKFYIYFFLVLNAVLIASGTAFLIWFNTIYGHEIIDYFKGIKIYSGAMRNWLYYSHAAFLSFFGLIGVLFLHDFSSGVSKNSFFKCFYHFLIVALIILMGTRITLMIYCIFLANIVLKMHFARRIYVNMFVFLMVMALIFVNIDRLDVSRKNLWKVTCLAIKEKPWFGYGLGSSDKVLHSSTLLREAEPNTLNGLNHSHNQFLTFFLELGIFGSFLIFMVCIVFFARMKLYENTTMVLFFFGLCYIFLTESIFKTSKPFYIVVFLFLLISKVRADCSE